MVAPQVLLGVAIGAMLVAIGGYTWYLARRLDRLVGEGRGRG